MAGVHPLALAISLGLHLALLVWLAVALPDFGERLESGEVTTIEVVMEEAETPPRLPVEAAPLPERQPTRTPEPSPPAPEPAPEPPGQPSPPAPRADAAPEPPASDPAAPEPPASDPAAPEPPAPEPAAPRETAAADTAAPDATTVAPAPSARAESAAPERARPMAALADPPRRRPTPPAPATEPEAEPDQPAAAATETPSPPPPSEPEVANADADDAAAGAPRPDPDTRREEREEPDQLDALLQSVEELSRRVEAEEPRAGSGAADVETATGRLADMRAQRLGRLIYEQIIGCWNPPAGLDGLREVGPVEIRAEFRQNGEVVSATVGDGDRLATDRVFRSVAESARRAVYNCAPLQGMPSEFHSQWRVVILEFRPDQIAAGG